MSFPPKCAISVGRNRCCSWRTWWIRKFRTNDQSLISTHHKTPYRLHLTTRVVLTTRRERRVVRTIPRIRAALAHKSVSEARINHNGHAWSSIVRPAIFVWIRRGGGSHSAPGVRGGARTGSFGVRPAPATHRRTTPAPFLVVA